jgi:hypothetical protein
MIATIKTGARHTRVLAKGAWLATTVWWAGGVVEHVRDRYQDRQSEAVIEDQVQPADRGSVWQRVRGWASESLQIVRVRTALTIMFYVLGVVLVTELSQASCMEGHAIGCKIAKSVIGAGN